MITPIIKNEGKTVIFGPCRLSYTHLFTKYSKDGDEGSGKYMTNVIIPKSEKETIKALESAIEAAKKAGVVSKWESWTFHCVTATTAKTATTFTPTVSLLTPSAPAALA